MKIFYFGLVGCVGLIVDFGVTFLLKEKAGCNQYLANTGGFSIAATNNYFLNRFLTFNNSDPEMLLQYGKFVGIAVIGLCLSNGIVWLLYEKFKINFYVAKGMSVVLVMFWNFSLNALYTFA